MPLGAGARLGPYEIVAPLGAVTVEEMAALEDGLRQIMQLG